MAGILLLPLWVCAQGVNFRPLSYTEAIDLAANLPSPDVRQKQTAFALFCLKSCMYSYFKELHIFWFISRIFFSFTLISFLS